MELITSMFPQVGSIVVICFVIAQATKQLPVFATKFTPVFVLICGAILGGLGHFLGIPGLDSINIYDAIATGAASGLASSGAYSLFKNLTNPNEGNN